MKQKIIKSFLFTVVIALISFRQGHAAYIDPNTGGMVFQMLAVLFGVISGLILLFSSRIKAAYYRVRRTFREQHPSNDETSEE